MEGQHSVNPCQHEDLFCHLIQNFTPKGQLFNTLLYLYNRLYWINQIDSDQPIWSWVTEIDYGTKRYNCPHFSLHVSLCWKDGHQNMLWEKAKLSCGYLTCTTYINIIINKKAAVIETLFPDGTNLFQKSNTSCHFARNGLIRIWGNMTMNLTWCGLLSPQISVKSRYVGCDGKICLIHRGAPVAVQNRNLISASLLHYSRASELF